jgi:hypothetical protein
MINLRRGMEGAKRRAEEPAVATRAPAEQADPKARRAEDGARIVALSHCGSHGAAHSAAPWRTQDVPRAFSNSSRGRKGDLDVGAADKAAILLVKVQPHQLLVLDAQPIPQPGAGNQPGGCVV